MANRVAPIGTIVREIGGADESTVRLHECDDRGSDFAVIKLRDRIVIQAFQRRRQVLCDYCVAGLNRGAVGFEENLAQPWIAFQLRRERLDFFRQVLARDVAIAGQFLGGRRDLLKLHRAEAPERRVDACNLSRHANPENAVTRQVLVGLAVANVHVGSRLQRRSLSIVERVEGVGLCHIDEHEAAAAKSARGRIRNSDREFSGDCRVDGVAALFENFDAGVRSVVAFRHDHPMRADRGRLWSGGVRIGTRRNEQRDARARRASRANKRRRVESDVASTSGLY